MRVARTRRAICAWLCTSGVFFFSSRRRHTRCSRDWSSDVCSSDLKIAKTNLLPDWIFFTEVIAGESLVDNDHVTGPLDVLPCEQPAPKEGPVESLEVRSEEHTSELQSRLHLVCRLLLEKKNQIQNY